MASIYSPEVRREALRFGITDLQAYRRINAREAMQRANPRAIAEQEGRRHDK